MIELIAIIVLFACCMFNYYNATKLAKTLKEYQLKVFNLIVENDRLKEDLRRAKGR